VVPAQGDLAVRTLVLHILQTVQTEREAETRPEHGEAEDDAEGAGHGAGLAAGGGRDVHLAAGTLEPSGAGTQLWHGNLHHLHYRLHSWLYKSSSVSSLDGVLV